MSSVTETGIAIENSSTWTIGLMSSSPAQSLPEDVLYEIFNTMAAVDPPRYAGPPDLPGRMPVRSSQSDLNLDLYPLWTGIRGPYWHAELEAIKRRNMFSEQGTLGFIVLTHVCRSWRRAGIDLAPLWGEIVHIFPSALETILARARGAPLALDFGALRRLPVLDQVALHDRYYMLLTKNVVRIRSLVASNPFRSFRDWYGLLLDQELPVLEDLTLKGAKRIPEDVASPIRPLIAPSLLRLVLDQTAYLPFSAPALRTLLIQGATQPVPASTLLAALSATPQLEKLELMFSLDDEPAPEYTPSVHLPNLAIARLCDSPEALSIWRHIVAPPNAELRLHAFRQTILVGPVTDSLGQVFSAIRPHTSDAAIDAFSLTYDGPYRTFVVALGLCSSASDPTASPPTNRVTMRLLFRDIIMEFGTIPTFLSRLAREMVPANIKLFHVSPCPPPEDFLDMDLFDIGNLQPVLQAFAGLYTISVGQEAHQNPFLNALGRRDNSGSVVAQSLKTIVFATIDEDTDPVGKGRVATSAKRWSDLASVLSARADAGHKLPRLVLKGVKSFSERIQADGLPGSDLVRAQVEEFADKRTWAGVATA
ncbi:unnamed protein product [Peniophora sp. CBMAI 1063]|nr:unnamed protein product [Peniophora sp. CBMAI 1063]